MRTKIFAAFALLPASLFAQATASSTMSEYFTSSTITGQWTCSGTNVSWYTAGNSPGMYYDSTSTGNCYAPVSVGTSSFDLRFALDRTKPGEFSTDDLGVNGNVVALTTGTPGSETSSDYSIYVAWGISGIMVGVRHGELIGLGEAGVVNAFNSDPFDDSKLQVTTNLYDTDPVYTVHAQNNCNYRLCMNTISWPVGSGATADMPASWHWWFHISRDGSNNLTFDLYTDHYRRGQVPWHTLTYPLAAGAQQAASFNKLVIGAWGNRHTTDSASIAKFYMAGYVSDITVQAGLSGTAHTVTSVIPANASGSIQSGQAATVIGTGFDCANYPTYTAIVGGQTATATCTNSTHLAISSLPSLTNNDGGTNWIPYTFHVKNSGGVDAELNGGLIYHAPTVFRFSPFEIPSSPANSADATIDIYGYGFSSSTTVCVDGTTSACTGGQLATVSYIDPSHITAVMPSHAITIPGTPTHVLVMDNGTTLYDSTAAAGSAGAPPFGVVLNFGYASHPYVWFDSTALAALRTAYNNASYASWKTIFDRDIQVSSSWPFPGITNCGGSNCFTSGNAVWPYSQAYHWLVAGDSTSYNNWWTNVNTTNEIYRIDWTQGATTSESFHLKYTALPALLVYDANFASLTPAQRAVFQDMFVDVASYFNYMNATNDPNTKNGGSGYSNRVSVASASSAAVILGIQGSLNSIPGYTRSAPYLSASGGTTLLNSAVTNLVGYGNSVWTADGGNTEGMQYAQIGGDSYAMAADAFINTNSHFGNAAADRGLLNTNFKSAASYIDQAWSGYNTWWSQVDDTEPIPYMSLVPFVGWKLTGGGNALYTSDQMAASIAAMADAQFYVHSSDVDFWPFLWRVKAGGTSSFTGWNTTSVLAATATTGLHHASIRSSSSFQPDLYLTLKGSANELTSGGHTQQDQGSFTMQSRGEEFLIDPGYFMGLAPQQSLLSIDGVVPTKGNANQKAYIDSTATYSSADSTVRSVTVNTTAVYGTAVTSSRRTLGAYVNGTKRLVFLLDDIVPTGAGNTIAYFQAGQTVSGVSASGFTMAGASSKVIATFDGPTRTTGSNSYNTCTSFGNSWINCYEGVPLNTVTATYTASSSSPMVTFLAPANSDGSGALTATVDRSTTGQIALRISDGAVINFTQGGGIWTLTSSTAPSTGSSCQITTTSLPNGKVGVSYGTQTVGTSGCSASTFSKTAGALPTGLSLNTTTGAITGTPTTAGSYSFTIAYDTASLPYTVTIAQGCSLTPSTQSDGTVGTPYTGSVSAQFCSASTYTKSAGTIPPGLTLDSASGSITGTPTTAGTYNYTVAYDTASVSYTVNIAAACQINATSFSNGVVGSAYSSSPLSVSSCNTSTYQISSGALPLGLSLNSTTGVVSGTPTTAATYSFSISYDTDVENYTIVVLPAVVTSDTITYTNNTTSNNGLNQFTWNSGTLGSANFTNYSYGESLFLSGQFCDPNNAANCTASTFTISTGCSKQSTANSVTWNGCSISGHTFTGAVTYSVGSFTPTTGLFAGIALPTMQETVSVTNTDTNGWNLQVTAMAPSFTTSTYDSSTTTNGTFFGVGNALPVYTVLSGTWQSFLWIDNVSGFADGNYPTGQISTTGTTSIKVKGQTGWISANATAGFRMNERFAPTQSGVSLTYSVAPDAFSNHLTLLGGKTLNWGDRRPILADFFANNANRSSTNPFATGTGNGDNTAYNGASTVSQFTGCNSTGQSITATNYQKTLVAEACKQLAELNAFYKNYKLSFQGVIGWDLEGQEFAQALSYLGDPYAFVTGTNNPTTPYNPYLQAAQAYFNVFLHASQQPTGWNVPDMRVGITLRPQHTPYYETATLPASCSFKADNTAIGANGTQQDLTGSMTAADGTNTVTITDSKFATKINGNSSAPNTVGSTIIINGAGPSGSALISTVSSLVDANHITIADTASTTVSNARVWINYFTDYADRAIVTNATFGNKFRKCQPANNGTTTYDNINNIFTGTGTWSTAGAIPNGDGVQPQYILGDTTSVINELANKVRLARRLFNATIFYVDSTVWVGGGPMPYQVWKTLNQMFPDVLFIPEQEDTNTYMFATPFTDPQNNQTVDPQLSPTSTHRIYAGSGLFLKAQDYIGTAGVGWSNTTKRANFVSAGEIGDIWSTYGWNSGSGADTNMGTLYANTVVPAESTITVTNSTNSKVYTFAADAKTTFDYPLVARVYFATNAATLPASSLYCEAGRNASQDGIQSGAWTGGSTCTLDLSSMHAYEVRYYNFAGTLMFKQSNGFTMNF